MTTAQHWYQRLVDGGGNGCDGIRAAACEQVPGNFFRTIGATFLTKLGDALTSPKITLAWLLGAIGAPVYLVGLLVPIREAGALLPQLAIASVISRLAIRKWVWVAGALVQAAAIAAIGSVAMLFSGALAGWLVVAMLVLFSLARACSSISAKDVLGKTIPKAQRGQTTGWAASAAGLVTIAVGVVLLLGLSERDNATFYGAIVLAASCLWLAAAAIYARIDEQPGETRDGGDWLADSIGRLSLLRDDAVFRRFVITRALLLCSALSAPYYIALAQSVHGSPAALLGVFIGAAGLASLVSAPVWGRLADRSSRKVVVAAAAAAASVGLFVVAVDLLQPGWFDRIWLLPLLYFLLSIAHQGARVGRKTYVVDIATGNERTDYVAVSNTVIGLILLATGLIGAVGTLLSTTLVIAALSLLGVAGAIMGLRLPEA